MSMISVQSSELVSFTKFASSFVNEWRARFSAEDDMPSFTIVACFLVMKKAGVLIDNIADRNTILTQIEAIKKHLQTETVTKSSSIALDICVNNMLELLSPFKFSNLDFLAEISHCVYAITDTSILLDAFNGVVSKCYFKDSTIYDECVFIPNEIAELAVKVLNVKEGESICNPYAGMAACSLALPQNVNYIAQEHNTYLYKLAVLRLYLMDRDATLISNVEPLGLLVEGELHDAHYLMIPPFSYDEHVDWKEQYNHVHHKKEYIQNAEVVAYDHLLYFCEESSCIVLPATVLFNKNDMYCRIRRKYTGELQNYKVILLPSGLYSHTAVQMAMIVIENDGCEDYTFTFVDGSDCYTQDSSRKKHLDVNAIITLLETTPSDKVATVNPSDITEKDFFSWHPNTYLRKNEFSHLPEGYKLVSLKELVRGILVQNGISGETFGHVVQYSDLRDNAFHIYTCEDFPNKVIPLSSYKVTSSCLLLSLVNDFKPTFVEADEEHPLYVSRNIASVVLDNEIINPQYLVYRLRQVNKDHYFFGGVIPRITLQDLYGIEIPVCPLNVQKSLVAELKQQEKDTLAKDAEVAELIDQLKTDYANEIRFRKHDMMPHLRQLDSARKNLLYYLEHKDDFSEKELFNGLRTEAANQTKAIEELKKHISIFSRELNFGEPEVINIYDYLVNKYFDDVDLHYIVDFIPDNNALTNYGFDNTGELYDIDAIDGIRVMCQNYHRFTDTNILISRDDLKRLFDNIVNNAVQHGFSNNSTSHCIQIKLSVDQERDMFIICFTNNGNPLPQGMDKTRFGLRGEKAGSTGGTGEGGHIVKSIVEHYGGDYDIFCNASGETVVAIYLPIFSDNEQ